MGGVAVYAGSFDPPTLGHVWMMREAARLFDRLLVAIGVNPDKQAAFPVEQRLDWLREVVADATEGAPAWGGNIEVTSFGNMFLVEYARSVGAGVIVRGIRNEADHTFERAMRHINADLQPDISTVFLMPPRSLSEISSSTIKGMIGPGHWRDVVKNYIPTCVFRDLQDAQ